MRFVMNTEYKDRNLITIFTKGDIFSKLSYIICGAANIRYGQIIKGLLFLLLEISYIVFMVVKGGGLLHDLTTLGDNVQGMAFNESLGIYEMQQGDNSMLILLAGVVAIVITIAFFAVFSASFEASFTAFCTFSASFLIAFSLFSIVFPAVGITFFHKGLPFQQKFARRKMKTAILTILKIREPEPPLLFLPIFHLLKIKA